MSDALANGSALPSHARYKLCFAGIASRFFARSFIVSGVNSRRKNDDVTTGVWTPRRVPVFFLCHDDAGDANGRVGLIADGPRAHPDDSQRRDDDMDPALFDVAGLGG